MKTIEYFKLNFNMAKNDTMIATLLAFLAPILASLGERESIRSFLMGTDGPSPVQTFAGVCLIIISAFLLGKGVLRVGYDNLFGEVAQIYASLPVTPFVVTLTKVAVLSLNSMIALLGFLVGTIIAWIFGNNAIVVAFFDGLTALTKSGEAELVAIIPLGVTAIVMLVIMLNSYIFSGLTNSFIRPKSGLGKLGLLIWQSLPLILLIFLFVGGGVFGWMFGNPAKVWIVLLISMVVNAVLTALGMGVATYRLNRSYYL